MASSLCATPVRWAFSSRQIWHPNEVGGKVNGRVKVDEEGGKTRGINDSRERAKAAKKATLIRARLLG